MNFTSCRNICRSGKPFVRQISISHILETNHYTSLGVNQSATQDEIKTAYFKLSKKFHPDLNNNSEESTRMFRQISAAYEILGNEKSRKQYDMENSPSSQRPVNYYRTKEGFDDESERWFYEQTRKKRNIYTGKTDHFDFDMWYDFHYNKNRRNQFHQRYQKQRFEDHEDLFVRRRKAYMNQTTPRQRDSASFIRFLLFLSFFCITSTVISQYMEYMDIRYADQLRKKKFDEWKKANEKES